MQFDWKHKCSCGHTAQSHTEGDGTCHANNLNVKEEEVPCTCQRFKARKLS